MRHLLYGVSAFFLCLTAAWLLWPSRNVAGNPALETRIATCVEPGSGTRFTLYRGEAGATVAFWYSVTADPAGFGRERQVFYSYSAPAVSAIKCTAGSVELVVDGPPLVLDMERVRVLRQEPIAYRRNERWYPGPWPVFWRVSVLAGGACLLLAFLAVGRIYRRGKAI